MTVGEVILHSKIAYLAKSFGILKDFPLPAFTVELQEVNRATDCCASMLSDPTLAVSCA